MSSSANAQVFHFADSSTTLIKTTKQSPAHWYLEIFNDAAIDTTLRWKANFVDIPAEWSISFDTQAGYFNPIYSGDSADFALMDSMLFPQKLIIGAFTNNTPGEGSVFMDIYDPADPSGLVTIQYEFIITESFSGIHEFTNESSYSIRSDKIEFYFKEATPYSIISASGQIVKSGNTKNSNCDISDLSEGIYFISVQMKNKIFAKKFRR